MAGTTQKHSIMNDHFRRQFPSLNRQVDGQSLVFLDGPAGTQVPESVIEAISNYYRTSNANSHGAFLTTRETDHLLSAVRSQVADFMGAAGAHTVSFGQNMTTLNYSLSKAIGRALQPGDEIVITQLDHEANRGPWLSLRDQGVRIQEVRLLQDGTLDYDDMQSKITERTRLVAMGWASNMLGTINDVMAVRQWTHQVGAWLLLDAVHYAPHFSMDVQQIDCDFLLCSAYKFYGPHVGLLYSRPGLLDRLQPDRLRTTEQQAPYSIETGTLNHAALAGVGAAIEFLESYGEGEQRRSRLLNAMARLQAYEKERLLELYSGLSAIRGIQIYGPPVDQPERAPTLSFVLNGLSADEVCARLATEHIFAWSGHFYALRALEVLGLQPLGGLTRMGISGYIQSAEIDRTVAAVERIAATV